MRAEIKTVIKKIQTPRPNISREEQKALKELRKDNTRVILTADKGACLVVMDKEEYIEKVEKLLKEETYMIIPTDSTNRQKNKLIQILKKIKEGGAVNEETYKKMYPTRCWYTKVLWVTKDPQGWSTTKTYCLQQGVSILWNSKGTGQDLETLGRKNNLQCPEHQGFC